MTKSTVGYKWLGGLLALWLLTSVAVAAPHRIVVLGDSLSAAYGIEMEQGWVALLGRRLGNGTHIVNASISGETSRGGRTRLPALITSHQPDILVLELGGNDGLRGIPLAETRANLQVIIELAIAADVRVLLVGMRLPPNLGAVYGAAFTALYGELADRHHIPLVPYLLDGVGGDSQHMQADGIHPRASAQPRLLENLLPYLEPLL